MKRSKPYYFRECGMTLWMTATQYLSLRKEFQKLADYGSPVAAARLLSFGPSPLVDDEN